MNTLEATKKYIKPLFTRSYWLMLADYVGIGKQKKSEIITDSITLADFLGSRASHVAQTSLYGYLRTRSGTRFPALFESPEILMSINIAKWQIWLACVSDLTIFSGQCLYQSGGLKQDEIQHLIALALNQVLEETGLPDEAGEDFAASRDKVLQRVNTHDWSLERDDDTVFSASPDALYYWSPIADDLKQRDETIVKNSIRFRWIEIRRSVRKLLDYESLSACES